MAEPQDATAILSAMRAGDPAAPGRLLALVYDELREIARGIFRRGAPGETLQPTALVHEAFLRLIGRPALPGPDRAHFLAACARAMRDILADQARRRRAKKRGGELKRVTWIDCAPLERAEQIDVEALDAALGELEALDERQVRVVEYRFFSGMTVNDIAELLGVSRTTVEQDWRMARAWLSVRLTERRA